jgi:hypothetical protein
VYFGGVFREDGKIRHLSYVPGVEPEIDNPETIYNIYRDYIKHEDELINLRLLSNIILQGVVSPNPRGIDPTAMLTVTPCHRL